MHLQPDPNHTDAPYSHVEGPHGRVAAVGATIFFPGSGFIVARGHDEDPLRI